MFGTNRQFNLERLPFSTKGAFLSIYQDVEDKHLYFTVCRGMHATMLERPKLMRIALYDNEKEIPFVYEADEAKLTCITKNGTVEFIYEMPQLMRIRVKGISLKVFLSFRMHEGAYVRENNSLEVYYKFCGKFLFVPLSGSVTNNAFWNFRRVSPDPFEITVTPGENGIGEMAIHEDYSNVVPLESYMDFDEAANRRYTDFSDFAKKYAPVPEYYGDMAKKAAYTVYQSVLGPRGTLKTPVVYMHKLFITKAFGWQQCFHALAMKNDPTMAWELLFALFEYQNSEGGIPDHVTDQLQDNWVSTKPPLFGYAVCRLLDEANLSFLTEEDYRKAFDRLSAYSHWWLTYHDHTGTGYPSYYHANESGYDESTAFNAGLPIQSPDLIAYTAFNLEACSRLASILGMKEEAGNYLAQSQKMIDYLVNEMWDGEQFEAVLPKDGSHYKCGSITQLQPIMLGKRLPQEIIDKLTGRLMNPDEYMTEYGVATENLKSDKVVMRAFTRGAVVAPTEYLIISGLYDAGKTEEARRLSILYLNALNHEGLALGIHPYRVEPALGNEIVRMSSGMSTGFPFTSWVGSIYLSLAARL